MVIQPDGGSYEHHRVRREENGIEQNCLVLNLKFIGPKWNTGRT
jgi:hypothetical protein